MDMAFWPNSAGRKSVNLKILFHNSDVLTLYVISNVKGARGGGDLIYPQRSLRAP